MGLSYRKFRHKLIMTTAAEILKDLGTKITPEMVKKIKGVFAFDIGGQVHTADLKKEGKLHKGKVVLMSRSNVFGKHDLSLFLGGQARLHVDHVGGGFRGALHW